MKDKNYHRRCITCDTCKKGNLTQKNIFLQNDAVTCFSCAGITVAKGSGKDQYSLIPDPRQLAAAAVKEHRRRRSSESPTMAMEVHNSNVVHSLPSSSARHSVGNLIKIEVKVQEEMSTPFPTETKQEDLLAQAEFDELEADRLEEEQIAREAFIYAEAFQNRQEKNRLEEQRIAKISQREADELEQIEEDIRLEEQKLAEKSQRESEQLQKIEEAKHLKERRIAEKVQRKADELQKLEEDNRLEEEAQRKADELEKLEEAKHLEEQRIAEEVQRKADELEKLEEANRLEEETQRKADELEKLEEAKHLEEQRIAEEVQRKADELEKLEEANRLEEETQRKAYELKKLEEAIRLKEQQIAEEVQRKAQDFEMLHDTKRLEEQRIAEEAEKVQLLELEVAGVEEDAKLQVLHVEEPEKLKAMRMEKERFQEQSLREKREILLLQKQIEEMKQLNESRREDGGIPKLSGKEREKLLVQTQRSQSDLLRITAERENLLVQKQREVKRIMLAARQEAAAVQQMTMKRLGELQLLEETSRQSILATQCVNEIAKLSPTAIATESPHVEPEASAKSEPEVPATSELSSKKEKLSPNAAAAIVTKAIANPYEPEVTVTSEISGLKEKLRPTASIPAGASATTSELKVPAPSRLRSLKAKPISTAATSPTASTASDAIPSELKPPTLLRLGSLKSRPTPIKNGVTPSEPKVSAPTEKPSVKPSPTTTSEKTSSKGIAKEKPSVKSKITCSGCGNGLGGSAISAVGGYFHEAVSFLLLYFKNKMMFTFIIVLQMHCLQNHHQ